MRYILCLTGCILLFAQCRTDVDVQPTGTYDTLGITWMTIERDNIQYYFQGNGVKGASVFTDIFEDAYVRLNPIFNAQLPQKLRFFVWTDWEQAEQLLEHPLSFASGWWCECHVRVNHPLGHEVTHILEYWSGGTPRMTYARLVTEGVAIAFDLEKYDKMERAKLALVGQDIHSIKDLWSEIYDTTPEAVFYPIAGAFMDFLYKQNLPDEFYKLLKYQTLEDAEFIYGKERLDGFIKDFDSQLGL